MQTNTRSPIRSAVACVPLFVALLLLATPAPAKDWPGFQGPDRDGVAQDPNLLTDWPDAGPPVLWTHDVGPGFGGAAIANNNVYILDRNGIAGDTLRVYQLNTGKPRWTADYDAPGRISYHGSRSTPTVTNTHAFTVGSFGQVTCFDLNTKQVAWQLHMDDFGADPPKWAWSQSPLLFNDTVIIAPMAKDAGLVALNPNTGQTLWKSSDIGAEGYGSPRLITLHGKPQIVTLTSTQVTGVDPTNGDVLWSYTGIPVKRGIPTPTAVGDNRIFITAGYDAGSALIEITKHNEKFAIKEIKRDNEQGGQIHSALLVDGHLYANLNTNENIRRAPTPGLACFDLDANLLWTSNNQPDINRGAVLAINDHLLTLGGEDGVLRLIKANPKRYEELHAVKVFEVADKRNMIWAPMAYADGHLILRSQSQLKCLDLRKK